MFKNYEESNCRTYEKLSGKEACGSVPAEGHSV